MDNKSIQNLNDRNPNYIVNKEQGRKNEKREEKIVEEHMQVGQGNLDIGLSVNSEKNNAKFTTSI